MPCPLRMDPAVHLPPGIFHTRHIAGDERKFQKNKNKCSTSPPLIGIPEMASKRMQIQTKRRNLKKKGKKKISAATTAPLVSSLCLFQCVPYASTHHPALLHRAGIPFSPRRVTHGRSGRKKKKSVRGRTERGGANHTAGSD